MGNGPRKI